MVINSFYDYPKLASSYEELFEKVDNVSEDMPAGPIKDRFVLSRNASKYLYEFINDRSHIASVFGKVEANLPTRFSPGGGAEVKIAEDAISSYFYAAEVLNDRFYLGEEAISKNFMYSVHYATDVMEGAFPLGEEAISKDCFYSFLYARDALKGPFPLGEEAISKGICRSVTASPNEGGSDIRQIAAGTAVNYAVDILKDRFVAAEPFLFGLLSFQGESANTLRYAEFLVGLGVSFAELSSLALKFAGVKGQATVMLGEELFNLISSQER